MAAHNHKAPLSDVQLRVKALENVLVEKGLVDEATLESGLERIAAFVVGLQAEQGSAERLVMTLLKDRALKPEEAERIRAMLEDNQNESPK